MEFLVGLLVEGLKKGTPSAEMSDVFRIFDGYLFAKETRCVAAIVHDHYTKAEWTGDTGQKGADGYCRKGPDFDIDGSAVWVANQTGTDRRYAGKFVEPVIWCSFGNPKEAAAAFGQFTV